MVESVPDGVSGPGDNHLGRSARGTLDEWLTALADYLLCPLVTVVDRS
jgi:hypothetical protein